MRGLSTIVVLACARVASAEPCAQVDDKTPVAIATATTAGEYALSVTVQSASPTRWNERGNEALVLEVSGAKRGFIGHLIVHQGRAKFEYGMHVGALAAGEAVRVQVSNLSAAKAVKNATACSAKLAAAGDGVAEAPEYRWPVQKAFDDVPLVVGWSKAEKTFIGVMTNENGGTAEDCGGGAQGMQAEIARWGRSLDIEDHYKYGGTPRWERCNGQAKVTEVPLRMEGAHPILYLGNGHNRLYESRGGYGKQCGARKPEKPDGDLAGWNVDNKSDALADDAGHVIVLRPLPVELDPLDYAKFGARREALADRYAPWLYRLSSLELEREGKIDDKRTFPMQRYLYADVQISNVGGEGGTYCAAFVKGGFKLHAYTKQGARADSAQITSKFAFGGHQDWKRVAIPLPAGVRAADITKLVFDAYDNDGAYVTGVGDVFIPAPEGDDGAKLDYVRKGITPMQVYVDDDRSGCVDGVNTAGPGGAKYKCAGGDAELPLR